MKINDCLLEENCYIIAEAGLNHDGSLRKAKKLVRKAAAAGANAVKFQLLEVDKLIQVQAYEQVLQLPSNWLKEFSKFEFPREWLPILKKEADKAGIDFIATPLSLDSLDYYMEINPPAIKIASGDINFLPMLRRIADIRGNRPVILSIGASTDAEIETALNILGRSNTVLLDCVMSYPADPAEYSIERMKLLGERHRCAVGISDHTVSNALPVLAAYNGAVIIERHFTLNKKTKGGDHHMSIEPEELSVLTAAIRDAVYLRNTPPCARKDDKERKFARRGIYARLPVKKGEIIEANHLTFLRPAAMALDIFRVDELIGHRADRDYPAGQPILPDELTGEGKQKTAE